MARASPVKRSPESSRTRTLTTSPGVTSLPGRRAVARSDLSADTPADVLGQSVASIRRGFPVRPPGMCREQATGRRWSVAKHDLVPSAQIDRLILTLRGHRVLLDLHLAPLYGVDVKVLNQAVKRNLQRFPADFMFKLTDEEAANLRSQIVTSSWGGRRYGVAAFTEQGVAMLSSVLRSPRAIQVNIEIVRTFVRLRQMLQANEDLARKLLALEKRYDAQFRMVFDAIRELMEPPAAPRPPIGFQPE